MVIVSHPTGNPFSAAVASGLYEHGLLAAFFTSVYWNPEHPMAKVTPAKLRALLELRSRVNFPASMVHTQPFRELVRSVLIRAGRRKLIAKESSPFSIDSVYRVLDKKVADSLGKFPNLRAVYAYEDGCVAQFARAHAMGLQCLYDLPIGYWRANREMSMEEAELQPEWKGTLNALADGDAKLARKDKEIELADTIVVASGFTRSTLRLYPGEAKRVVVIPYGTPPPVPTPRERTKGTAPLRVLYVGSLTQRKGISYLFAALDQVGKSAELTVVGRKVGSCDALDRSCERHRWIASMPHAEILAEMRRNDVLVFPSLFEGFGLVIGEAMSQGMPVITTPHTGGPDILRDGQDGFIVPIRSAESIAARLTQLHEDRELLWRMGESARLRAGELSWQQYKDSIAREVGKAISAESEAAV
jgi:glycosyltransferase involved in cell wall biosynthesis